MKPRHGAFPRYSNSDASRNALGDALLWWLPFVTYLKTTSGLVWVQLHLAGLAVSEASARKSWTLFRQTPWGFQIGPIAMQTKPWAMSSVLFRIGGAYVGKL